MRRSRTGFALLGAVGVAAIIAIASGSAATTTKPYTANFSPGPVAGGSSAVVNLKITNLTSPQTIEALKRSLQALLNPPGPSV